ncbi:MAG: 30S ribosomal protein S20 [Clostridia bacterium]|nr:30S ribosomal protein S20 [Clostridia bacterium]
MPNIKSAKKRVITSETRQKRNTSAKSALRTSVKKARVAIANDAENKEQAVKEAGISLDKAAAKGLIHKNTAARKKSRLAKAANKDAE